MRGIILIILVMMLGCAQPEIPVPNETVEQNVSEENISVVEPEDTNVTITPEPECAETDGGIQSKIAGEVQKGEESYMDYCINRTELLEYACLGNEIANTTITCSYECKDGQCIEAPEPEPGCQGPVKPDMLVADSVTINGSTHKDICIDFTTVKDFYCKDNELKAANNQCPPGYRCNAGACEELVPECTDSDLGPNINERGRTVESEGLHTTYDKWDECVDGGMVLEHYCGLDGPVSEEIECGSGYKCIGGRCIESDCSETDDGFDIYKKGTTTFHDTEKDDKCVDDYELREYYCYGEEIEAEDLTCPKGYICDRDRCVEGSITHPS